MNEVELEKQVRETISRLDNERLVAMMKATAGEYTPEALAFARAELDRRGGIEVVKQKLVDTTRKDAEQAAREDAEQASAHAELKIFIDNHHVAADPINPAGRHQMSAWQIRFRKGDYLSAVTPRFRGKGTLTISGDYVVVDGVEEVLGSVFVDDKPVREAPGSLSFTKADIVRVEVDGMSDCVVLMLFWVHGKRVEFKADNKSHSSSVIAGWRTTTMSVRAVSVEADAPAKKAPFRFRFKVLGPGLRELLTALGVDLLPGLKHSGNIAVASIAASVAVLSIPWVAVHFKLWGNDTTLGVVVTLMAFAGTITAPGLFISAVVRSWNNFKIARQIVVRPSAGVIVILSMAAVAVGALFWGLRQLL